jgi:cytochrome c
MRLIYFIVIALLLYGCKENTKLVPEAAKTMPQRGELSQDSKIFLGNRLFSEKTCITCHDINQKKVGPSVIEIMKIYKEKDGDIVVFLKGQSKPIVDTTATQVAIMQANIDGFGCSLD